MGNLEALWTHGCLQPQGTRPDGPGHPFQFPIPVFLGSAPGCGIKEGRVDLHLIG